MHELSIAQNIVEIVKQSVPLDELKEVTTIKLKIGEISGIVSDSLEFGFQAITSGTELEKAKLNIEKIPFVFKCNSCNSESTNDLGVTVCPECESTDTKIVSGLEMQIVEVELKETIDNLVT
jgi:hydrogenase nickel incorporation protein HypA/HybF